MCATFWPPSCARDTTEVAHCPAGQQRQRELLGGETIFSVEASHLCAWKEFQAWGQSGHPQPPAQPGAPRPPHIYGSMSMIRCPHSYVIHDYVCNSGVPAATSDVTTSDSGAPIATSHITTSDMGVPTAMSDVTTSGTGTPTATSDVTTSVIRVPWLPPQPRHYV